MQIKFLQTSTAMACLAVAGVGIIELSGNSVNAMNEFEIERAVKQGILSAEHEKKEQDKARGRNEWWEREGKAEARKQKENERKWAAEAKERLETKIKDGEKNGIIYDNEFKETLAALAPKDLELWEEWDAERNWAAYFEVYREAHNPRVRLDNPTYSLNTYYVRSKIHKAIGWCSKDQIVESNKAGFRLGDLQYFLKYKDMELSRENAIEFEIRQYKEKRAEIDKKWKKDKRRHRELFPEKTEQRTEQRCKIS